MIKRDSKGRFAKGSSNPWNKNMKGYTNSGSFTSEGTKGENNPFYGKRHTKEVKGVIGKASLGKQSTKGKHWKLSQETKDRMRDGQKERVRQGKHNFYKGGASKLYGKLRHSLRNAEWRDWRTAVFQRDNYTCQRCGARSGNGKAVLLHPHHIFSVVDCVEAEKLDLIYEVTNGETLCVKCHRFIHRKDYQTKTNYLENGTKVLSRGVC